MAREIAEALEIVKRGGPAAINRALVKLEKTVFSFSMKVCGNREDAQDTMQETLFLTVPYLSRFDDPDALAVWLYKVAKSRCLMSRRKSRFAPPGYVSLDSTTRTSYGPAATVSAAAPTPENELLRHERRQHLQQAVLRLPDSYRLPLILHDMEGLSTRQTAEVLEVKEGTVRVRLHRARLFLRDQLATALAGIPEALEVSRPSSPRCKQLVAECSDYLDARLDDTLCDRIRSHLHTCEPCRAFLATMQATIEQCRHHRPGGDHPELTARMRRLLLESYRRAMVAVRDRERDDAP